MVLPRQYMKRTQMDTEDEFEEEAEENLSVETEDEIRAGPVDFMSRWLGRRCSLEQSQKLNTDTIFYHSIVVWRDSVIARCLPRKFNINKLEAAVYYERQMCFCRRFTTVQIYIRPVR